MARLSLVPTLALLALIAAVLVEGRIGTITNKRDLRELQVVAGTTPDAELPPLTNVFPLTRCQGDCDYDSDCEDGLTCFQRSSQDPVPGCQDGGEGFFSSVDYCILPIEEPTEVPMMNVTEAATNMTNAIDDIDDLLESAEVAVQAEESP